MRLAKEIVDRSSGFRIKRSGNKSIKKGVIIEVMFRGTHSNNTGIHGTGIEAGMTFGIVGLKGTVMCQMYMTSAHRHLYGGRHIRG